MGIIFIAFIIGFNNIKTEQMPFRATIHNGKIYGYFNISKKPFLPGENIYDLVEVTLTEDKKILKACLKNRNLFHYSYRYTIAYGNFWLSCPFVLLELGRIPQEDMEWFSRNYKGDPWDNLMKKYPKASWFTDYPCYKFSIEHEFFHANTVFKITAPVAVYDLVFSDLLPTSSTSIRSFLLYEKKEIKTWTHQGTWDAKEENWKVRQNKEPDENFPSAFLENFYVFGRGEDYYFVTSSGQLFLAKKPAPGKTRQMRALWDDAKKPITAILDDTDHGRTWLVAREKGQQTPVAWFLEIKENSKAEMFFMRDLPAFEATEPLRTILQYDHIRKTAKVLQTGN